MTYWNGRLVDVDFDSSEMTFRVVNPGRVTAGAYVIIGAQDFDQLLRSHPDAIATVTRMRGDSEAGSGRKATRARAEGIAHD